MTKDVDDFMTMARIMDGVEEVTAPDARQVWVLVTQDPDGAGVTPIEAWLDGEEAERMLRYYRRVSNADHGTEGRCELICLPLMDIME